MKTQLILIEGIPGSGKSTMAKRIHEWLSIQGYNVNLYNEGDIQHPIDLTWYAHFTTSDYEKVIIEFNAYETDIRRRSVYKSDYVLVQYRDVNINYFDDRLFDIMQSHEVCYCSPPSIKIDNFTQTFCDRWSTFVNNYIGTNYITIFESAFFQHQIHDLLRNYSVSNDKIIEHLQALSDRFSELNPVLLYISQFDVKDSLNRTAIQRNKPKLVTDEAITYWQNRKTIEYEAMSKLRLRSYVIDNSEYNWDKVYDNIMSILKNELS